MTGCSARRNTPGRARGPELRGPGRITRRLALALPVSLMPGTVWAGQRFAPLGQARTVMLVTHQVEITALIGRAVGSGEVFLLRPGTDGSVTVPDEIAIAP